MSGPAGGQWYTVSVFLTGSRHIAAATVCVACPFLTCITRGKENVRLSDAAVDLRLMVKCVSWGTVRHTVMVDTGCGGLTIKAPQPAITPAITIAKWPTRPHLSSRRIVCPAPPKIGSVRKCKSRIAVLYRTNRDTWNLRIERTIGASQVLARVVISRRCSGKGRAAVYRKRQGWPYLLVNKVPRIPPNIRGVIGKRRVSASSIVLQEKCGCVVAVVLDINVG